MGKDWRGGAGILGTGTAECLGVRKDYGKQ